MKLFFKEVVNIAIVAELVSFLINLLFGTGILMLVAKLLKVQGNFKIALIVNAVASAVALLLGFISSSFILSLVSVLVVIPLIKKQ